MADRPPGPEHFTSAPPPPAPPARRNIAMGVLALIIVAGALADAFMANRRAARAEAHAAQANAARHAAELERRGELRRAAEQVSAIRKRMHALVAEAGLRDAAEPVPDAGASR